MGSYVPTEVHAHLWHLLVKSTGLDPRCVHTIPFGLLSSLIREENRGRLCFARALNTALGLLTGPALVALGAQGNFQPLHLLLSRRLAPGNWPLCLLPLAPGAHVHSLTHKLTATSTADPLAFGSWPTCCSPLVAICSLSIRLPLTR